MKRALENDLRNYFRGEATINGEAIREAYESSDEMTRTVVRYRCNGGNYQRVQMELYISQSCYYARLKKFFARLKKSVKKEGKVVI